MLGIRPETRDPDYLYRGVFTPGVANVIQEARNIVGDQKTYLSFDIDGIDPAFTPGTGTPEIGGILPIQAQEMIRGFRGCNIVGADLVEVAPPFDPSGNTALIAATMMYEIMKSVY